MNHVHLHVHSDASLKDGLGPISRLVSKAKELGFEALALTDHGSLANAVAFTIECETAGIKPILGVEGYIRIDNQTGHITLLADGNEGWENLVKLNNLGHASEFKEPAFTLEQLVEHANGLVCLTGCVASPLNSLPYDRALEIGRTLKMAFEDRLFAEVMFVGDMKTWERPVKLAHELKIPIVVTNDVHFAEKADADIHTILTKIKAGYTYNSAELYLKLPAEILFQAKRLMGEDFDAGEVSKWLRNTISIAKKITPVKLAAPQKLPAIEGAKEILINEARRGLVARSGTVFPITYYDRLEFELSIIDKMGFSTYFVILKDIIDFAKRKGVRVGAGRGSGAGSLVLYSLGITDIDPIKYGLQFERFLNPERKGMPDVDVDFDSEMREVILEYTAKKYNAKPIAVYSRYMHKSLVHELGKFFLVSKPVETAAAELGPDSKEFKAICETKPEFEQAYDIILNQIRHKGKHAGGVIITDTAVPVERTGTGLSVAWTEGKNNELSYAGVVKFDLLGLSALAILKRLESRLPYNYSVELHPEVFSIFQKGDLAGVFQFAGSAGIRELTMKLHPTQIEDLIAINALYRPGALDAGTCQKYPDYKKEPRKVPALFADVLTETYGVVVYQEQLMGIIQRALAGTFAEADLARRVITKGGKKTDDPKHIRELNELKTKVIDGMVRQGVSAKEAAKWWEELETHGRYSFNKSHSAGYATIAWQMAWWKYYEPANFYAECLNVDPDNAQDYIMSAVESGVSIIRPDINKAKEEWSAIGKNTMVLPLSALKFLSVDVARIIVANRPTEGYTSIRQFIEVNQKRIVRAQAREALWYMGAFKDLDGTFEDLELPKKIDEPLSTTEVMQKYLGFIVPTSAQYKSMQEHITAGYICGIISDKKLKKSKYGQYMVYYLSPTGVFWSRDILDLKIGQIVAYIPTGRGKAKTIVRITP